MYLEVLNPLNRFCRVYYVGFVVDLIKQVHMYVQVHLNERFPKTKIKKYIVKPPPTPSLAPPQALFPQIDVSSRHILH